jgi:CubicO group peptidase (beta-lactamase class C family)
MTVADGPHERGVEHRLAKPIGMEDFRSRDVENQLIRAPQHPAYMMNMTARDLARFGWLYLNKGNWAGKQIVPEAWVAESTKPWSDAPGGISYGYLWCVSKGNFQLNVDVGAGPYSARGTGGQYVFVIPAYHMVIVHLFDDGRTNLEVTGKQVGALLKAIIAAAPKP